MFWTPNFVITQAVAFDFRGIDQNPHCLSGVEGSYPAAQNLPLASTSLSQRKILQPE